MLDHHMHRCLFLQTAGKYHLSVSVCVQCGTGNTFTVKLKQDVICNKAKCSNILQSAKNKSCYG